MRWQEGYRRLCRLLHIERRRLPEFASIEYHFVELEVPPAAVAQQSKEVAAERVVSTGVSAAVGAGMASVVGLPFVEAEEGRELAIEVEADGAAGREAVKEGDTTNEASARTSDPSGKSEMAAADLVRLMRSQLTAALTFIAKAEESGGEVLLHAGHGPPGLSRDAVVYVALAFFISKHGDSLPAATRRLCAMVDNLPPPPCARSRPRSFRF